ncbi:MAG: DUF4232 domain-containing protein [Actinomycetota bacterium]|nr:DUF4232 domain-containing protein [Actinomycetota bacterium]MDQ2958928.1 DUF4232 domain-containing protein [Actinomycetota bacterium]
MRLRIVAALFAVLTIVLAGCGGHSSQSQVQPSVTDSLPVTSTSDSPTDSATDTATDTTTDTSTAPTPTVAPTTKAPVSRPPVTSSVCAPPYLKVIEKGTSGGDSHIGYLLIYTNTGQIACSMTGYPGLAILDSAGKQITQAARTPSGYLGGIRHGKPPFPTVLLNAGDSASALLEGVVVDSTGKTCPSRPALLTTAPSTTVSIRLPVATRACWQVQIHPVVAGTTGSKP